MKPQEKPRRRGFLADEEILRSLLGCSAPLMTESPHLELNGAKLITVIMTPPWNTKIARRIHTLSLDIYIIMCVCIYIYTYNASIPYEKTILLVAFNSSLILHITMHIIVL